MLCNSLSAFGLSPYNIERFDENRFEICVARAGFSPNEVALTA
jgi:hypothetical protein